MMNHFILPTMFLLIALLFVAIFIGIVEILEILSEKWASLRSKMNIDFEIITTKAITYLVWIAAFVSIIIALYECFY